MCLEEERFPISYVKNSRFLVLAGFNAGAYRYPYPCGTEAPSPDVQAGQTAGSDPQACCAVATYDGEVSGVLRADAVRPQAQDDQHDGRPVRLLLGRVLRDSERVRPGTWWHQRHRLAR